MHYTLRTCCWCNGAQNSQICSVADAGLSVAMENLAVKALLYNVYPPDLTYGECSHMYTLLYYAVSAIGVQL